MSFYTTNLLYSTHGVFAGDYGVFAGEYGPSRYNVYSFQSLLRT